LGLLGDEALDIKIKKAQLVETRTNLIQQVFQQVTDEQLKVVKLTTGWHRMDSTQVLNNLAETNRLRLLIAVLQSVHKQLLESMIYGGGVGSKPGEVPERTASPSLLQDRGG
jgi:hypothetical protein